MSTAMPSDVFDAKRHLADPAVRHMLADFVRRRVPASDVDDVVQTVLVDALAAPSLPRDEGELRRWLIGIARHKVVDHHRRASREAAADIPDLPVGPPPLEARALAEWAAKQAGSSADAKSTLEWMAREGEGEKLEAIAEEEKVPAARVRQRVSRMRRWMKERWLAEIAAAAALAIVAIVVWRLFRKEEPITQPLPERPQPSALPDQPVLERARALRDDAFEACERSAWRDCLDRLDEAKRLDPAGDTDPRVGAARARAEEALKTEAPTKSPKDDSKNDVKDAPPEAPTKSPKDDSKNDVRNDAKDAPPEPPKSSVPAPKSPPVKSEPAPNQRKSPPVKGKPKASFKGEWPDFAKK